jgi:hypothetical protein
MVFTPPDRPGLCNSHRAKRQRAAARLEQAGATGRFTTGAAGPLIYAAADLDAVTARIEDR